MAKRDHLSHEERFKLSVKDVYSLIFTGAISRFPNGYLNKEVVKELIRWLLLERKKLSKDEILDINWDDIKRLKLGSAQKIFDQSLFKMLNHCFPEFKLKIWQVKPICSNHFDVVENRIQFVKDVAQLEGINLNLLEDVKRINIEMVDKYSTKVRVKAGGLNTLLSDATKFEEWQFNKVSKWTDELICRATRKLIEEILIWDYECVCNNISISTFIDNGFNSLIAKGCNNSVYKALNIAYPNKYKNGDLKKVRRMKKEI
jgi:hypothetical protein